MDIEEQMKSEQELHKATDSFQKTEVVGMEVIECRKEENGYEIVYDEYILTDLDKDIDYNYTGSVYLPVIIIDYGGENKSFSGGFFKSEKEAIDYLENIDVDNFRFMINEDSSITYNTTGNKLYEYVRDNIVLNHLKKSDNILLSVFIILISSFVYFFSVGYMIEEGTIGSDFISILFLAVGFLMALSSALIPFLISYKLNKLDDKFSSHYTLDIGLEAHETSLYNETSYNSVKVSIELNEKGLRLYSDELDCEWFYKRRANGLIKEDGVELINKIPVQEDSCILGVKDSGYSDSPWISENGEWWIDFED